MKTRLKKKLIKKDWKARLMQPMLTWEQAGLLMRLQANEQPLTDLVLKELQNPWGRPWVKFVELVFLLQGQWPTWRVVKYFLPHKEYYHRVFWFFCQLQEWQKEPEAATTVQQERAKMRYREVLDLLR